MESLRRFSLVDRVLGGACRALATLSDAVPARRPVPGASTGSQAADEIELTEPERRLSGALMRVNHVGEICAQALY
jgi:ubiquinone biosynthesis monooxygenase Coq7